MFLSNDKLHYAWREENCPVIRLQEYPKISVLCVVRGSDEYLERSQKLQIETKAQILFSFISPHQGISSSMVSNWNKATLML